MKSNAILCAIAAASLGIGSLSYAQAYDPRDGRYDGPPGRGQVYQPGPPDLRGDHRAARNDRLMDARGPQFQRGKHIPSQYRSRQYVVNDWRGHHLSPPPRGQHWVQVGADYALIAIATGVIAQLVLSN